MCDIMCKANLTRSLNFMQMLFPDEYDFYPRTWFLPEQMEQFQNDAHSIHKKNRKQRRSLTTFIVKPSGLFTNSIENLINLLSFFLDGSEGAGIYLIQDPARCSIMNRPHIVQGNTSSFEFNILP